VTERIVLDDQLSTRWMRAACLSAPPALHDIFAGTGTFSP
jgi:hypothetical protein